MDAEQIRRLKPMLTRYLKQFDDCFTQRQTRAHFSTCVQGQLSDLGEKSCEPIAVAAGIPPRNLQEFLSTYKWEEDRTRNRLQEILIREHSGPNSIGVIDETSDVKRGDKTPGVQRQWCGTVGKTEHCIVTVHLGYATGDFHCLLDGDLFLPEAWSADRARCRAAGIPDDVHRLDSRAARDRAAVSARQGARPQDAANGRRQPAGHQRREDAQILAGTAGSRVGAVSRQRRREGADGDQVLREQRAAGDEPANLVAGGVLPLAHRTVFRGPETRSRAGSVGRASLAGTVRQVHTAAGSLVRSGWLSGRASAALITATARTIQHWQQRNATARRCHSKRT